MMDSLVVILGVILGLAPIPSAFYGVFAVGMFVLCLFAGFLVSAYNAMYLGVAMVHLHCVTAGVRDWVKSWFKKPEPKLLWVDNE